MAEFNGLRQYGTKVYKLQQHKSLDFVDVRQFGDDRTLLDGGMCMGIVMLWLREKLTTTNSAWGPSPSMFVGGEPTSREHHQRNGAIMESAALVQIQYMKGFSDTRAAGVRLGLRPIDIAPASSMRLGYDQAQLRRASRVAEPTRAIVDGVASLAMAHGAIFECSIYAAERLLGRHAIGLYRSRGNKPYFFDPRCGVYQVHEVERFVRTWADAYAARGWTIVIHPEANQPTYSDGFHYFAR